MMIPCFFVLFSAQNFVAAGVRVSNFPHTDLRTRMQQKKSHQPKLVTPVWWSIHSRSISCTLQMIETKLPILIPSATCWISGRSFLTKSSRWNRRKQPSSSRSSYKCRMLPMAQHRAIRCRGYPPKVSVWIPNACGKSSRTFSTSTAKM